MKTYESLSILGLESSAVFRKRNVVIESNLEKDKTTTLEQENPLIGNYSDEDVVIIKVLDVANEVKEKIGKQNAAIHLECFKDSERNITIKNALIQYLQDDILIVKMI